MDKSKIKKELREWTNKIDSDDIKIKQKIKEVLLSNEYILYVLNNEELLNEEAGADEYYGVNILEYYLIKPTQTNVQNFICFETNFDELQRYNNREKVQQIVFYILCEQKNIMFEDTGIARHDLLAALLLDQFNWTNYFGGKIHCVSDVATVVDTNYECRTLTFEQVTDNNLVKTKDLSKIPRLANKDFFNDKELTDG